MKFSPLKRDMNTLQKPVEESLLLVMCEKALKGAVVESITEFGAPYPKKQFEKWSDYVIDFIGGMRDDLATHQYHYNEIDIFVNSILKLTHTLDVVREPRLIHGDLWPKNILIKKKNDRYIITGVLDSERAYWGDEISEWIHYFLNVSTSYWDGYGELYYVDNIDLRKTIYRGMHLVLVILEQKTRYGREIDWAINDLSNVNKEIEKWRIKL